MGNQQEIKENNRKREEMFQRLIEESPFVAGDEGEFLEGHDIEWLDPKLIKEGQEFARRNSFALVLAHLSALLFGFSFKNLTTVLLRTGKFTGVENTVTRYVETEMHVKDWYELDILGMKDKGFKDIQRVRKMHTLALKQSLQSPVKLFENVSGQSEKHKLIDAMRKDLERFKTPETPLDLVTYHPTVIMSQFDMAITQFGFFGIVYLLHDVLGIKDTRGMKGFIHLWAVVGRLLGIQDRFNLALHADWELSARIFKTILLPGLIESDMTTIVLQEDLHVALQKLMGFRFGSLKFLFYYALTGAKSVLPEYEGENLYKLMDWWDISAVWFLRFVLFLVYHFHFIRVGIYKIMKVVADFNNKKFLGVTDKKKSENWSV